MICAEHTIEPEARGKHDRVAFHVEALRPVGQCRARHGHFPPTESTVAPERAVPDGPRKERGLRQRRDRRLCDLGNSGAEPKEVVAPAVDVSRLGERASGVLETRNAHDHSGDLDGSRPSLRIETHRARHDAAGARYAATQVRDFSYLKDHLPSDARVVATDVTSAFAVLSIMGPHSRAFLQSLTPDDLSHAAFPFGTSRHIDLGYARVRASRVTYVGELGWELYIPTEFATGVFDVLVAAGAEFGLRHAGYHALNSLRMEKGYRHWGDPLGINSSR